MGANGGYRSPAHRLNDSSPHCWGTAADIYRVGDTYLDDEKSIPRYRDLAESLGPQVCVRRHAGVTTTCTSTSVFNGDAAGVQREKALKER